MSLSDRREAKQELQRLLEYWRNIECWIKQVEVLQKRALIPAINELRYASRQLFNAVRIYGKGTLSEGDKSALKKRLIIARQYLLNADHDICDALLSFVDTRLDQIEGQYGLLPGDIERDFPQYGALRQKIAQCLGLVVESRRDYDKREWNYGQIRQVVVELTAEFPAIEKVAAAQYIQNMKSELELKRLNLRAKILEVITFISFFIGIASLLFGVVPYL
jgi:hypothetical protein